MAVVYLIEELRWRLFYVGVGLMLASGWCYYKRELLVYYLEATVGLEAEGFYFLDITEGFSAMLSLVVSLSLIGSLPLVWLQMIGFMSRGLFVREQKLLWGLMCVSLLLTLGGVLMGVKLLIPRMWEFFIEVGGSVGFIAAFGVFVERFMKTVLVLVFSAQLMVILPALGGWLKGRLLVKGRPWVICGLLVFAAGVTPPDIGSQLMVFLPLSVVYESVVFSCILYETSKLYL